MKRIFALLVALILAAPTVLADSIAYNMTYEVGTDLPAGDYELQLEGNQSAYYEITRADAATAEDVAGILIVRMPSCNVTLWDGDILTITVHTGCNVTITPLNDKAQPQKAEMPWLEAHFLDVGHGDCAIIICDGETMIIDGGQSGESDRVYSAIRSLGITDIKYAIATHPQADHVGGLPAAFHAATVHALYTPVTEYSNDRFQVLLDKAEEMDVPVIVPAAGDTLSLGGATITIISPIKPYKDANDMSIVLRIDYGQRRFLFCGDAGTAVEKALLKADAELSADVIKVAHHGSKSATSTDFANAVSPAYAVISCSARYDNPDNEVLTELYQISGCRVLRTDTNGDIVIRTDGTQLTCTVEYHYVGNIKTEVVHRMTCNSVEKMKNENMVIFYTYDQAEYEIYRPCKNCSP